MRPPILYLAVAFGAGLAAGLASFGGLVPAAVLTLGALAVCRRVPAGAAAALAAVAGLAWAAAARDDRAATCAGRWAADRRVHAAVVRLTDNADSTRAVVKGSVERGPCGGALTVRWPDGHPARGGTAWLISGSFAGDAARGVLVARRVRVVDPAPAGRGALRGRIAERTARLFGARAPLVDALVLGRRTDLDPATRERYVQAGLAHLLAISGLHVGFLAAWVMLILTGLGFTPRRRLAAGLALVWAYVWLLGFPDAAMRATLMLGLAGVARLGQRVVSPRGLLGLTAFALMIADPWAVQSVGAWLSFTAVAAVIWASRATAKRRRWIRTLAPAAAATAATAPLTAYAFGTVAPVGVIANLAAIPLAMVAVPGIFAALLASLVAAPLAALLAGGAGLFLSLLDATARLASAIPGGHFITPGGLGGALPWGLALGAAWWIAHAPRRPFILAARAALVACLVAWSGLSRGGSRDKDGVLTVHFLDVGQGDAALLRTPHGRWIAIDGGPRTPQEDAGRRVVIPFLRRQGAPGLDVVVATHGDADHLGGLPALVGAFPPALVLEPGQPLGRPLYLEFLAAVEASGARYRPARAGDSIEVDGVGLRVLSPDSAWLDVPVDVNDHGVVLRVTYGTARILFQADAGLPVEARLAGTVGPVDVLKVGHHGSSSATGDTWLDELRPHWAVISVGAHNTYGHPAPDVVARLGRHGITVLRTDQAGTITFATDGQRESIDGSHDH